MELLCSSTGKKSVVQQAPITELRDHLANLGFLFRQVPAMVGHRPTNPSHEDLMQVGAGGGIAAQIVNGGSLQIGFCDALWGTASARPSPRVSLLVVVSHHRWNKPYSMGVL
tara:strand:- start:88 stop:423 length:336 start_codon:yes stop_codon:yes gene_type:complete